MKIFEIMTKTMRRFARDIMKFMNLRFERLRPFKKPYLKRYDYQKLYVDFDISATDKVLDIGSGSEPFPFATHLAERYIEPTCHRYTKFVTNNLPLTECDVQDLPFDAKSFDFVYCAHVLEHVDDPISACREIMRVGKRGYIETPSIMNDMLFSWAKGMHKWHVSSVNSTLVFQEYNARQLEGIRSNLWREYIFSDYHNPIQDLFYSNKDIFNTMFSWVGCFQVVVIAQSGSVKIFNGEL